MAARDGDLRPEEDDWWVDGVWGGPHDLRVFLRANWFFALFWLLVLSFMSTGVIAEFLPASFWGWYTPLLAASMGLAGTLFVMFLFSRGWVGDGD